MEFIDFLRNEHPREFLAAAQVLAGNALRTANPDLLAVILDNDINIDSYLSFIFYPPTIDQYLTKKRYNGMMARKMECIDLVLCRGIPIPSSYFIHCLEWYPWPDFLSLLKKCDIKFDNKVDKPELPVNWWPVCDANSWRYGHLSPERLQFIIDHNLESLFRDPSFIFFFGNYDVLFPIYFNRFDVNSQTDQIRILEVFSNYCDNLLHVCPNFDQQFLRNNFTLMYKLNQAINILKRFSELGILNFSPKTTFYSAVRKLYLIENKYFKKNLMDIFEVPPPLTDEEIEIVNEKKNEKKPSDKVKEACVAM